MTHSLAIKLFLLIAIFVGCTVSARCQAPAAGTHSLYGNSSLFGGSYWGVNVQMNYIAKSGISLSSGISWGNREATNLPADYALTTAGFLRALISLGLDGGKPKEEFTTYSAQVGKVIPLGRNSRARFIPQLGVAATRRIFISNFKKLQTFAERSTYDATFDDSFHLGVIVSPKFEISFVNWLGLHLTPVGQFSSEYQLLTLQAGLIIGKL